jgi:hypothetical protein
MVYCHDHIGDIHVHRLWIRTSWIHRLGRLLTRTYGDGANDHFWIIGDDELPRYKGSIER